MCVCLYTTYLNCTTNWIHLLCNAYYWRHAAIRRLIQQIAFAEERYDWTHLRIHLFFKWNKLYALSYTSTIETKKQTRCITFPCVQLSLRKTGWQVLRLAQHTVAAVQHEVRKYLTKPTISYFFCKKRDTVIGSDQFNKHKYCICVYSVSKLYDD